jgi:hypothetical protein
MQAKWGGVNVARDSRLISERRTGQHTVPEQTEFRHEGKRRFRRDDNHIILLRYTVHIPLSESLHFIIAKLLSKRRGCKQSTIELSDDIVVVNP